MSISNKNEPLSDARLEEMLLSLRDDNPAPEAPPVVNTFRLRMEAERRRNKRQVKIVAVAAWFSVTATLALLAYLAFVMLPQMEKHFSPETRLFFEQLRQSLASCQGWFWAFGATLMVGYIFSAVLMGVKRDVLFKKDN